jgi:hypothetical protein
MLSPGEIAQIKAEIERLEQLRKNCTDSGIRERIEAWIKGRETEVGRGSRFKIANVEQDPRMQAWT